MLCKKTNSGSNTTAHFLSVKFLDKGLNLCGPWFPLYKMKMVISASQGWHQN